MNDQASAHTPGPWKAVMQFGQWYVRQDLENWTGMGCQNICILPAYEKGSWYGDMFAANARLIASAPAMVEELARLRAQKAQFVEALSGLYELCLNAKDGAFHNGVTDSTCTIDEGDVRASEYLDRARAAIRAAEGK
ncbi:unnamed protein product [Sphagnum jensenii]